MVYWDIENIEKDIKFYVLLFWIAVEPKNILNYQWRGATFRLAYEGVSVKRWYSSYNAMEQICSVYQKAESHFSWWQTTKDAAIHVTENNITAL